MSSAGCRSLCICQMLIVDVDVDCKLLWFILSCLPPQQQHLASADNKLLQDLSYRPVPGQKKL